MVFTRRKARRISKAFAFTLARSVSAKRHLSRGSGIAMAGSRCDIQSAATPASRGRSMKRREFFEKAGIGSAALVTLPGFDPGTTGKRAGAAGQEHDHEHDGKHEDMDGPLASADVAFGQWDLETPLDRFPNNSPRTRNYHHLTPGVAQIKAGGADNFHIPGLSPVLVLANG